MQCKGVRIQRTVKFAIFPILSTIKTPEKGTKFDSSKQLISIYRMDAEPSNVTRMRTRRKTPKRFGWQILNSFKFLPGIPAILGTETGTRLCSSVNNTVALFRLFRADRQGHDVWIRNNSIIYRSHRMRGRNRFPIFASVNTPP